MPTLVALAAALAGAVLGALVLAPLATRVSRDGAGMRGWRHRALGAALGGLGCGVMPLAVGVGPQLAPALWFALVAAVLTMTDLAELRIPNVVLGPGLAGAALLLVAAELALGRPERLLGALLGAAAYFGLLLAIALLAPSAMGMGDVKLAALAGLLVGGGGPAAWFAAVLAGFLAGGALAAVALLARRTTLRGSLPFGPPLLLGVVAGLALGSG